MPVTPTSSVARACQGAIEVLARSTVFQTRIAAAHGVTADPDGAKEYIFGYEVYEFGEESLDSLRPFAVVIDGETDYSRMTECQQPGMGIQSSTIVVIADNALHTDVHGESPTDSWNDSWLAFLNFAYGTMDDCAELFGGAYDAGASFYWPFHTVETIRPAARTIVGERTDGDGEFDYWDAFFELHWGEGSR